MKKIITIAIIVLLALGFGYFLFKISPQQSNGTGDAFGGFDLSAAKPGSMNEPGPVVEDDHILGDPNAKNVFVVYEDIQCPACAAFEPTLKEIPFQLTDTKVVFRHFPLLSLHKNAANAAYASEAANAQGKFWDFTNMLYFKQNEWSTLADPLEKFAQVAAEVGVEDIATFRSDYTSRKYKDRIQRDMVEATNLNVGGTPTLYFNGKQIENGGIESIKQQAQSLYK